MNQNRLLHLLVATGALALAVPAHGAGYAILEQSVSGLGNAFAGGAAAAEDPSTIFFNPAGMSRLDSVQLQAQAHWLTLGAYFSNDGSHLGTKDNDLGPITGRNNDGGFSVVVPSLYFVYPLPAGFTAGLAVNSPFGLATKYDSDWVGRYMAVKSEIKTIDVSPCISYQVNDQFSIGAGLDVYTIEANLTNAIDFNQDGTPLLDGFSNLEADDDALGAHLGLLWQARPDTRLGVNYRSQVVSHVKGDADFAVPPALAGSAGLVFFDQNVSSTLRLPASASLSVLHNLNDKIDLMADITWTDWSSFGTLDIDFANPATEAVAGREIPEEWRDTWRYSAGVSYKWSDTLKLRGGVCYDTAAVKSSRYRSPRIPDAARLWLTCGLSWRMAEHSVLDFGYVHIFVEDGGINNDSHTRNQVLIGEIEAQMDIVSLAYTHIF